MHHVKSLDVIGFPLHGVTPDGHVWSYRYKKFLRPLDNCGKPRINLTSKGKGHYSIAKLVAAAFLNVTDIEKIDIKYKDGDIKNLHYTNLIVVPI